MKVVLDTLEERGQGIRASTKENLWEIYVYLLDKVRKIQQNIARLNLPTAKSDVLFATDAGPGVGCSNIAVRFRGAEVARMLNFDRLNRILRVTTVNSIKQSDQMPVLERLLLMEEL